MWGTPVPPEGWLELNGQLFNPSGNPMLSSLYPSGQIPDFRGYFPRGWDNGSDVDTDGSRAILTVQNDAIRNITGSFQTFDSNGYSPSGVFSHQSRHGSEVSGSPQAWSHSIVQIDASSTVPTAEENRPKNIAVMFIIKAG
ncbi:phage tail protein [Pectobacterium peruviense]|uniref:phage tail protein n=1 Tax=Pectobacterium peruviense TaxID=2066479 RepID=UPI0009BACB49|nr:phage tail protein [Pectobacterium peruviense]